MVIVRSLEPEDREQADLVFDEGLEALREVYRPKAGAFAGLQRIKREMIEVVAVRQGEIVGLVAYYLESDALHFLRLATARAHRKRGIARALIEKLMEIAAAEGCRRVAAETIRETGNVAIFERIGFEVVSEKVTENYESDRFAELHDVKLELIL